MIVTWHAAADQGLGNILLVDIYDNSLAPRKAAAMFILLLARNSKVTRAVYTDSITKYRTNHVNTILPVVLEWAGLPVHYCTRARNREE